jgi:hypothetical protein
MRAWSACTLSDASTKLFTPGSQGTHDYDYLHSIDVLWTQLPCPLDRCHVRASKTDRRQRLASSRQLHRLPAYGVQRLESAPSRHCLDHSPSFQHASILPPRLRPCGWPAAPLSTPTFPLSRTSRQAVTAACNGHAPPFAAPGTNDKSLKHAR